MKAFQSSLLGHDSQIQSLNQLIQADKLPASIIFSGGKGLGKASLALQLAAYLVEPEASAQHELHVIGKIAQNAHPRAYVLSVQSPDTNLIPIEAVREARKFMYLSAQSDQWRVLIVDAIDQLNRFGANALLKIAEEPRARTLLIFINHNRSHLLPTLRSRSYFLSFHDIPMNPSLTIDDEMRDYIAGNPSRLSHYEDETERPFFHDTLSLLTDLFFKQSPERIRLFIQEWFSGEEKSDIYRRLEILQVMLMLFTQKHSGMAGVEKLWQANDSLQENIEKYRVFHLDLSALLCQTLGTLIYPQKQ